MPEQRPAYCLVTSETDDGVPLICNKTDHNQMVRHKFIPQDNMPDALHDAMAAQLMGDLEADATDLLPADPPTAAMQTMHELAELVGLAEIDRRFDVLSYTTKTLIGVAQDLRIAKVHLADDRPVDPAVMERIKKRVDAWLLQVGTREDGGA